MAIRVNYKDITAMHKAVLEDLFRLHRQVRIAEHCGWYERHPRIDSSINIIEVHNDVVLTLETLQLFREKIEASLTETMRSVSPRDMEAIDAELDKLAGMGGAQRGRLKASIPTIIYKWVKKIIG